MIILELILKSSIVFRGSWGSSVNWLKPEIEPPYENLACPIPWNALYMQSTASFAIVHNYKWCNSTSKLCCDYIDGQTCKVTSVKLFEQLLVGGSWYWLVKLLFLARVTPYFQTCRTNTRVYHRKSFSTTFYDQLLCPQISKAQKDS